MYSGIYADKDGERKRLQNVLSIILLCLYGVPWSSPLIGSTEFMISVQDMHYKNSSNTLLTAFYSQGNLEC